MNDQPIDLNQERWCSACNQYHKLYYLNEKGEVQTTFSRSKRAGWQSWCKVSASKYNVERQRERRRELREQNYQKEANRSMSSMAIAIQQYDVLRRVTEHEHKSVLITLEEMYDIFDRFDFTCAVCGDKHINVAHIVALRCGGESQAGNVVPLCNTCKISKLDKDFETWLMTTWSLPLSMVLLKLSQPVIQPNTDLL